jgi:hypothetical protein
MALQEGTLKELATENLFSWENGDYYFLAN